MAVTRTRWFEIEDQDDNYLILSLGTAIDDNPNPHFRFEGVGQDEWIDKVFESGPGRTGSYRATEVLGGEAISGAVGCCVAHARNGEVGTQMWNGSGDDADDTSPGVCRLLADAGLLLDGGSETVSTAYQAGWSDDDVWMVGGGAGADVSGPSWFLRYPPVRDNLPPRGALVLIPQPEDYGYPPFSEGTEIEWEDPYAELLGLQIADGDPTDTAPFDNAWALNDGVGPSWNDDGGTGWHTGGIPLGGAYQWTTWTYSTGPTDWHDVPDTEGWEGHDWHFDYDDEPTGVDGVAVAQPATSAEDFPFDQRFARPALKFILRAARFRFVYDGESLRAPRRVAGNESPARAYPLSSQLRSNRVGGTYL